jgi:hypothetical protein
MDDQLSLPHDVYRRLVDAAQSEGTTPVGWIEERLPPSECECSEPITKLTPEQRREMHEQGKTLLDVFGDSVGSINSGGQLRASERVNELFGEYLEQKRREGRL